MKVRITTPNAPFYSDESTQHLTDAGAFGTNWYWSLHRFFFQGFRTKKEMSKWYYNSWIDFGEETILIKVSEIKSPAIRYEEIDEIRLQIYRYGEYSKSRYDYTRGSYILIKFKGQKFKYFLSASEDFLDKMKSLLQGKDVHLIC